MEPQTDVGAFAVLEPAADRFRKYLKTKYALSAEHLLVDRAQFLKLTTPEMTVLVGGMRVLNANFGQTQHTAPIGVVHRYTASPIGVTYAR